MRKLLKLILSNFTLMSIPRFFDDDNSKIVSSRGEEILETSLSKEMEEMVNEAKSRIVGCRPLTVIKICDYTNLHHLMGHAMLDTSYINSTDVIYDTYGNELTLKSLHITEHRYVDETVASAAGQTGWNSLNPWRRTKVDCVLFENKILGVGDVIYATSNLVN